MQYDLLVIGGGPGGFAAAVKAAQLGKRVALFECRQPGGTCLNRGCIPTKALMHSANLYREIAAGIPGVSVQGLAPDWPALAARKEEVVTTLRDGMTALLRANKVEVIAARAVITGATTVLADGATYEGTHILVAAGSIPAAPPIPGLDLPGVLNSDGLLDDIAPRSSLVIIGGGVIGVELATVWAALGCQVTVIEALDRILANLDREVSQSLTMQLKKQNVTLFTAAMVSHVAQDGDSLAVHFTCKGTEQSVCAPTVLAAMGRRANTDGLFEGIAPDTNRGTLLVDANFRTSVPSIYAIGDAIGGIQLAHKAEAEGVAVAELLFAPTSAHPPASRPIPSCVYTTPEIAQVGLTADEAKAQSIPVSVGKYVMGGNGRTVIEGGGRSFIKLVFHSQTQVLLGATLLCHRATDLIGELTTAVTLGLTATQLLAPVRPHPTFVEGITEATELAFGDALHTMPRKK